MGQMTESTKAGQTKKPTKRKRKGKAGRVKMQLRIKIQAKTEAESDEIEANKWATGPAIRQTAHCN